MSYLYKFPDFVSDDDTNPWINDGEELIRQGTKRRIAFNILYDTEKGTLCGKLEDDAYDQLIQETRQRYPSPRLRAPELTSNSSFNIIRGY